MQVGRLLVHVYHGGEDIAPPDLLFHKGYGFRKVGLDVLLAPAIKELRAGGDEGIHKHGAVFSRLAARRPDPTVDLLPVSLLWLDDMKVVLASRYVNVGIAGVFLLRALMVRFQRRISRQHHPAESLAADRIGNALRADARFAVVK